MISEFPVFPRLRSHDFPALPDDGQRYEILAGDLAVSPAPSVVHQRTLARVWAALIPLEADGVGQVVLGPVAVVLNPETVVQPDLVVVQADRTALITPSHVAGAPDLIVEVVSTQTRTRDLRIKAPLYCRASVLEYWVIDPLAQVVIQHQLTDTQYVVARYGPGEMLTTALAPDRSIAVADCFSD